CTAFASAKDCADDCAHTSACANLCGIIFRSVFARHAALFVHTAHALRTIHIFDLNHYGFDVSPATPHADLVEVELKFRVALDLAGSFDARYVALDHSALKLCRFDHASLKAVALLRDIRRKVCKKLYAHHRVSRDVVYVGGADRSVAAA